MNICCDEQTIGADPLSFRWNIVRGDTSSLDFQFLENDETTFIDLSEWSFIATAYSVAADDSYVLIVSKNGGTVTVTAPKNITSTWGSGYRSQVAELNFDLQGTHDNGTVWTPVIGTIKVLGDVTTGGL